MTAKKNILTSEGLKKLEDELDDLIIVKRKEVAQKIKELLKSYNQKNEHALEEIIDFHYQFEAIHPFYDGNGRTGRILNVLFLILNKLLEVPVIYPSRYIILHKGEYYTRINAVRTENDWEGFILFMLASNSIVCVGKQSGLVATESPTI